MEEIRTKRTRMDNELSIAEVMTAARLSTCTLSQGLEGDD